MQRTVDTLDIVRVISVYDDYNCLQNVSIWTIASAGAFSLSE